MAKRAYTRRERTMIVAAAAIFFSMIFLPTGRILAREYRTTHSELDTAVQRLSQARDIRRAVLEQREGAKLIAKKVSASGKGDFDLYNYTGSVLDKLGLKESARFKVVLSPPKISVVSIDIDGIGLDDLIKLMDTLQHGDHLVAVELLNNLEQAKDKKGLSCSITISSPHA